MKKIICLLVVMLTLMACDKSAKPIEYGEDQCDFCSMSIVQKTHSAQLVTEKGKQYKFDAIECMVNTIKDEESKYQDAEFYVANYSSPGEMISAKTATYLISKNLPSPMGANLTAFATAEKAKQAQQKHRGKLYQWEELTKVLSEDTHQHH
jgi:copper chaperone NosL